MKNFTIRTLNPDDRTQWQGLWQQYLDFYHTNVDDAVYSTTFKRLLDPAHHNQNAFIAEQDHTIVGLVHFIYHPHNWKIEDVCYLQDLFVAEQARKCGIGEALIRAVCLAAEEHQASTVYWTTQHFNATARKLYDKIATLTPFIQYSRTP